MCKAHPPTLPFRSDFYPKGWLIPRLPRQHLIIEFIHHSHVCACPSLLSVLDESFVFFQLVSPHHPVCYAPSWCAISTIIILIHEVHSLLPLSAYLFPSLYHSSTHTLFLSFIYKLPHLAYYPFLSLSLSLSVTLSLFHSIYLSLSVCLCLFVCLSLPLSLHPHFIVYLNINLTIHL